MRALGAKIERLPGLQDRLGHGLRRLRGCALARPRRRHRPGHPDHGAFGHRACPGNARGRLPIRREGDKLYGPGVWDMKSGGRIAIHAVKTLQRLGTATEAAGDVPVHVGRGGRQPRQPCPHRGTRQATQIRAGARTHEGHDLRFRPPCLPALLGDRARQARACRFDQPRRAQRHPRHGPPGRDD